MHLVGVQGTVAPFLEEPVPFDKGLTPALCSRMVVLVSRQLRITRIPSPLRLKFNGERIWSGEYVLADIFGLQRHLSRIDFEDLGV